MRDTGGNAVVADRAYRTTIGHGGVDYSIRCQLLGQHRPDRRLTDLQESWNIFLRVMSDDVDKTMVSSKCRRTNIVLELLTDFLSNTLTYENMRAF